jgi:hypothetical protein
LMCASAFCWHTACQRRGGNPPAHAFPWGKRERGIRFLAATVSSRWRSASVGHAPGLLCARSSSMFLSITITKLVGRSARSAFPEVLLAPPTPLPCFYPHSHGPQWARCMLGSDLKPRSITTVTDLGCWVLPSTRRSLKDHGVQRSHPNKAVDVFANKTSRCLLAFAPSTHVGYAPSSGFPNAIAWNGSAWWLASWPWPATLLPLSAHHGVAAHTPLR